MRVHRGIITMSLTRVTSLQVISPGLIFTAVGSVSPSRSPTNPMTASAYSSRFRAGAWCWKRECINVTEDTPSVIVIAGDASARLVIAS